MTPPIQWFIIMHIAAKHIRTQILHNLVGPVFPFPVIIIEINALLNNPQRKAQLIEINLHLFFRYTGFVPIHVPKITGTSDTTS